eukprot:TRINITY_DN22182_c0_g3_i4.p1 TRINITY_DN22182_c0_g3~~TRINITY_DN22182_c0_g3_i4.p1  ORF type:complete len:908 (-),score=148.59 TRINITY_DN22182_c0_g3_i4:143-2809(-)
MAIGPLGFDRRRRKPAAVLLAASAWRCAAAGSSTAGAGAVSGELPAVPWKPGPDKYNVTVTVDGTPFGATESLYPQDGVVSVATGDSLLEAMAKDADRNWYFVELYNSMCPHCWYAVPVVTDVARAFKDVEKLSFQTLNCYEKANEKVCFLMEQFAHFLGYPSMVLCPPLSSSQDGLVNAEAAKVLEKTSEAQRADLLQLARCKHVFKEPPLADPQATQLLAAGDIATWITETTGLIPAHPGKLDRGANFHGGVPLQPGAPPGKPGWPGDDKPGQPGVSTWHPEARWRDAVLNIVATIGHGYRAERHTGAVRALHVLAKAMPAKGKALSDLARRLEALRIETKDSLSWMVHQRLHVMLNEWTAKNGLPTGGLRELERYRTCSTGSCAFWTTLHVATSAVVARGISGQPLVYDGSLHWHGLTATSFMKFIRDYVEDFLDCESCKNHFLLAYDECAYGRCAINAEDWRGLGLWLWRAHNAISMRVALEQHAKVDRRWPMYQDCPKCWRESIVVDGTTAPAPPIVESTAASSTTSPRKPVEAATTLPAAAGLGPQLSATVEKDSKLGHEVANTMTDLERAGKAIGKELGPELGHVEKEAHKDPEKATEDLVDGAIKATKKAQPELEEIGADLGAATAGIIKSLKAADETVEKSPEMKDIMNGHAGKVVKEIVNNKGAIEDGINNISKTLGTLEGNTAERRVVSEERRMELQKGLTATELDEVFHTDHVLWFILRTYVGVHRMEMTLEDLTNHEASEVTAAWSVPKPPPGKPPSPRVQSGGAFRRDGSRPGYQSHHQFMQPQEQDRNPQGQLFMGICGTLMFLSGIYLCTVSGGLAGLGLPHHLINALKPPRRPASVPVLREPHGADIMLAASPSSRRLRSRPDEDDDMAAE